MRILVICQYYFPENFQITPICEELVKRGHEITVLTGLPNYPTGVIPDEYKKGHRSEIINGVSVIRCYEHGRKKGLIHLALNYLSFYCSAKKRIRHISDAFDLVFVYQLSPVFMGIPGLKYAKKNKKPLLVYCCDLWPESLKVYIHSERNLLFKFAKKVSKTLYSSAQKIIVQSASFAPYLVSTHGIHFEKITYCPAFSDESYLYQNFETNNDYVSFCFMGNLGVAQDLLNVLKAIEKNKDLTGFKVHFVGDGSMLEKMKEYVDTTGLGNIVIFHGRRPVEEMPSFYRIADVCLLSLKSDSQIGLTLPTKIQGYMAAGKPILGMINGSAQEVIKEAHCGICVNAGNIDGLADAMRFFVSHKEVLQSYGENSRKYFIDHFRETIVLDKIEKEIALCIKEYEK